MDPKTFNELKRLRKCLLSSQDCKEKLNELLENRETLINYIHTMVSEDPQLGPAKKKLVQLDHMIDDLEETTEHSEEILRKTILSLLAESNPINASEGIEIHKNLLKTEEKKDEVKTYLASLNQFILKLKEVESVRKEVNKQGILRFIFGKNPNFLISKMLKEAQLEGEKIAASSFSFSEVNQLLNELDEPWNYKRLGQSILPYLIPIEKHLREVENLEQELMMQIGLLENKIDKWIADAF